MRQLWRRIRANWNKTDTVVSVSNTLALGLLIGNCWWESVGVTYVAVGAPLGAQLWRARRDQTLRDALIFGAIVGALWPIGEWFLVNVFGWWGTYLAPGIKLLETPVYCMLVGVLASAHCVYAGRRTIDLGYGAVAAAFACGGSALLLGIIGENVFVAAGMWAYDPSALDLGSVPMFLPIAYGLGYATVPFLKRFALAPMALVFCAVLLVVTVGLGFLAGFFPR